MDPTGQSLLKLLFNEGESICVSDNAYGYHSIPLETALSGEIDLVSPNDPDKIRKTDSSKLILAAINPINGWRRDNSVTAFRSFLIEIDTGTLKEQLGTINHFKMPFSAQTFSGNKSVHTVITLDEDLPDEKTYRSIANWIFNIVTMCDQNCKNPSRSVRIPGAYREPGKKQRLIKLNKRVTHKELFDWLNQYEHLRPKAREKRESIPNQADFSLLSNWARGMMKKGISFERGRNLTWFALSVDFAKAGYTEDQTIEVLNKNFSEEHDFKEKEWLTAIRSGFKHVSDGK